MTISRRKTELSDDRIKVAIAYGFDSTNEEAAAFGDVSPSTSKRWKTDPEIRQISEAVGAYLSIYKSKQVKDAVGDAVQSAEERIKALFTRSLRLTERVLQKAEEQGDAVSLDEAKYIHENIAKWAAKFAASEAPKRMQVEGSHTHTHVAVLSLPEVENIVKTRQIVSRPAITGDVIDVDAN
jgi:hypothetical protein